MLSHFWWNVLALKWCYDALNKSFTSFGFLTVFKRNNSYCLLVVASLLSITESKAKLINSSLVMTGFMGSGLGFIGFGC